MKHLIYTSINIVMSFTINTLAVNSTELSKDKILNSLEYESTVLILTPVSDMLLLHEYEQIEYPVYI